MDLTRPMCMLIFLLMIPSVLAYGGVGGGMVMPIKRFYDFAMKHNLIVEHNDNFVIPINHVIKRFNIRREHFDLILNDHDYAEIMLFRMKTVKTFHGKEVIYSGMVKADYFNYAEMTVAIGREYDNIQVYTSDDYKNWSLVSEGKLSFNTKKFFIIIGDKNGE